MIMKSRMPSFDVDFQQPDSTCDSSMAQCVMWLNAELRSRLCQPRTLNWRCTQAAFTETKFMSVGIPIGEPGVLMRRTSWQQYVEMRDSNENRNVRMTFDRGELELISPTRLH